MSELIAALFEIKCKQGDKYLESLSKKYNASKMSKQDLYKLDFGNYYS